MWLLVDDLAALEALNAQHTDRQIQPVRGERGGWLIGADLLADCGDGCYWHGYCEWLGGLQPTDEVPAVEPSPV